MAKIMYHIDYKPSEGAGSRGRRPPGRQQGAPASRDQATSSPAAVACRPAGQPGAPTCREAGGGGEAVLQRGPARRGRGAGAASDLQAPWPVPVGRLGCRMGRTNRGGVGGGEGEGEEVRSRRRPQQQGSELGDLRDGLWGGGL